MMVADAEASLVGAGPGPLSGRRILVTRPPSQAEALLRRIHAEGGTALCLPTIDVVPLLDATVLDRALSRLHEFDLVIFVSANAVLETAARMALTDSGALDRIACAGAPGPGTAAVLSEQGLRRVIAPVARFDSEGLLEEMLRQGAALGHVLILRGGGDDGGSGRDWLADALRARGSMVEVVSCYRRVPSAPRKESIAALLARAAPDATTVTSALGGEYLLRLLGERALEWINTAPVFVPHPRIGARMHALGVRMVIVTAGGDAGLVCGMVAHFAETNP